MQAWSHLSNLQFLNVSMNNLTGTLPEAWSELTQMVYLDVSSINVHGGLPRVSAHGPSSHAAETRNWCCSISFSRATVPL